MRWLFVVVLCLFGCEPEPVRLLPLPEGVAYPWVVEVEYPAVPDMVQMLVARSSLHDAVTLGTIAAQDGAEALARQRAQRRAAELRRQGRGRSNDEPDLLEAPFVIDLNQASSEELQRLPRVGPAMAARIEAARPFRHASDLRRVRGVGPATWALLEPLVVVTSNQAVSPPG
jgi:DNA uptake protein ComE-like DNA-binding protein